MCNGTARSNVGTPRPFTTSGVCLTELYELSQDFMTSENGKYILFEVAPLLTTEADEVLRTELNEPILPIENGECKNLTTYRLPCGGISFLSLTMSKEHPQLKR